MEKITIEPCEIKSIQQNISLVIRFCNGNHNKFLNISTNQRKNISVHISQLLFQYKFFFSSLFPTLKQVAMVEVQINNDTQVPPGMLVAFAICTTLLVAVHMLALMISTCILPNIEAVCNLHSISLVHESPHERLHWYIETAWAFSTLLGLILFLIEIAILCWVKFYDLSKEAAWSACIVLLPVLIIFLAFAIHFYRSLMTHKYEVTASGIRELEILKEQMEHDHMEHHRNNGMHFPGSEVV